MSMSVGDLSQRGGMAVGSSALGGMAATGPTSMGGMALGLSAATDEEIDWQTRNLQGIAKIMAADPERGQAAMQQYIGKTQHSEGFLGGIVGSIAGMGGTLIKGLENVSSGFTEMFRNEEEGSEEPFWVDAWEGLTGVENTRWEDNLQSYGAPKDHWATSVGGLAGDILLDPTNYLGIGRLGEAKDAVMATTKALGEHSVYKMLAEEITKEGGMKVGRGAVRTIRDEDIPQLVQTHGREVFRRMGVSDDFLDSLAATAAGNAEQTMFATVDTLAQREAEWMGRLLSEQVGRYGNLNKMPDTLTSEFSGRVWKKSELLRIFQETEKLGPEDLAKLANDMGLGASAGQVGRLGRQAAAAQGGIRFKFGIPFQKRLADHYDKPWIGYRWQTGAIPFTQRFGASHIGDMWRGSSILLRADKLIQQSIKTGEQAGDWQADDLKVLMSKGNAGFKEYLVNTGRSHLVEQLYGGKAQTALSFTSEKLGGLTEALTPKARLTRMLGATGTDVANELRAAGAGRKQYMEFAREHELEWSRAKRWLSQLPEAGRQKVMDDSIRYLEGTGELDVLPQEVRQAMKLMKTKYPALVDKAKGMGGDVGDPLEVMAMRQKKALLGQMQLKAADLRKQLAGAQTRLKTAQETALAAAKGDRSAAVLGPEGQAVADEVNTLAAQLDAMNQDIVQTGKDVLAIEDIDRKLNLLRGGTPAAGKRSINGYFHRRLTAQARESIEGAFVARGLSREQGRALTAEVEKLVAGLPFHKAAEVVRDLNAQELGMVNKVLEDDVFETMNHYINDLGEAVYKGLLGQATTHLASQIGGVDTSLFTRITAHIPEEMYPNNVRLAADVTSGKYQDGYRRLHDVLDEIQVAIGAAVPKSFHDEGTEVWADTSARAGKNLEPWREDVPRYLGDYQNKTGIVAGRKAEYMRIEALNDLEDPANAARVVDEAESTAAAATAADGTIDVNKLTRSPVGSEGYGGAGDLQSFMDDLLENGFKEPVLVTYNNLTGAVVIGNGHHRLHAARELVKQGHEQFNYIPVVVVRDQQLVSRLDEATTGFGARKLTDKRVEVSAATKGTKVRPTKGGPDVQKGRLGDPAAKRLQDAQERLLAYQDELRRKGLNPRNMDPDSPEEARLQELAGNIMKIQLDVKKNPGKYQKMLDEAWENGTELDYAALNYMPPVMSPSELFHYESGRLGRLGGLKPEEAEKLSLTLRELNRAKAQASGMVAKPEVAFKRYDAAIDGAKWGRLEVPGLREFAAHPLIAAEFNRAWRGDPRLPGRLGKIHESWRDFLQVWKGWATVRIPGFHYRNYVGAWFNNELGGVARRHYQHNDRVMDVIEKEGKSEWAKKTYRRMRWKGQKGVNVTYGMIADEYRRLGIIGTTGLGLSNMKYVGRSMNLNKRRFGERMKWTGMVEDKYFGQITRAEQLNRRWEKLGVNWASSIENKFRGAAFLRGLDDAYGDTAAARAFVMMRHGDYDELTDLEGFIRDVVPFYKWMRTNLPYQIRQLAENPAKQLAVRDVQEQLIDEDRRKEFASYLRNEFALDTKNWPKPIRELWDAGGGPEILTLQLPLNDVFVSNEEFWSQFFPVGRQLVLENMMFEKNLFTGAPLDERQKEPLADWADAFGLGHVIEKVVPGVERGTDGKLYVGAKTNNMLAAFPLYTRLRPWLTEDEERKQQRFAAAWSAFVGVRPQNVGPDHLNEAEAGYYYDVMLPELQRLQALGYELPSADDLLIPEVEG